MYKFSIIPEEGWFGQPKYSTRKKLLYVAEALALAVNNRRCTVFELINLDCESLKRLRLRLINHILIVIIIIIIIILKCRTEKTNAKQDIAVRH